jgi:hypothetical protein
MEIKGIQSEINWIVEYEGRSFVRIMYIRKGEKLIHWKCNFDAAWPCGDNPAIGDNYSESLEKIFQSTIRENKINDILSITEKELKF